MSPRHNGKFSEAYISVSQNQHVDCSELIQSQRHSTQEQQASYLRRGWWGWDKIIKPWTLVGLGCDKTNHVVQNKSQNKFGTSISAYPGFS